MASNEIELRWLSGERFDIQQNGKTLPIDGNSDAAKSEGFKPKALILSSLAGCTAIDVVEILNKMRVPFTEFSIKTIGDLTEDYPKVYHTVHLVYLIRLQNSEDKDKMERAVQLSQEKYCGVSAMVRKFADLQIKIEYL
ncbi:MAG: OsmC family protein [Chitinophagales bacterium]